MKNAVLLMFLIFILIGLGWVFTRTLPTSGIDIRKSYTPTPPPATDSMPTPSLSKSIFVPYWAGKGEENSAEYRNYYYFGVRPTAGGTIENEAGLQNLTLVDKIPEKQKKLVLRMLDSTVTEAILAEKSTQKILISELLTIMSENTFSGIVLDIEVPFTLQADKKEQITKFVQLICTAVKSDYKTCDFLIYGDYSYRNRPYDVKALGEVVDTILLMAYDFHKAGGEPGPNFPFRKVNSEPVELLRASPLIVNYGYDFKTMIQDTLMLVPKNKIEVVFGMYGYDWTLNEQGTPLKGATALSLKAIQSKVLTSEGLKVKSNNSKEKSFEYVDLEGLKHIVWYEDEESVAVKKEYLQSVGIGKISYWAHTYY